MNKNLLLAGTTAVLFTTGHAAVVTNFTAPNTSTAGARVSLGTTFTLTYSVDATGQVSLDATAGSDAAAGGVTMANGWDNANVGSVTDTAMFGQTFTLTVSGLRRNNAGDAFPGARIFGEGISETIDGSLAIEGENSGRIDGGQLDNQNIERLQFTLSTSILGFELKLDELVIGGNGDSDVELGYGTNTALLSNIGSGAEDLSADNYTVRNGESFYFGGTIGVGNSPTGGGFNLDAFTFSATAIPEPSSAILAGLAGLGLIVRRRR